MMAKIILPLLLLVSAVAGDDLQDLCKQLTSQINTIQDLAPLEFNVYFHKTSPLYYYTGPAKFRIVSEVSKMECTSAPVDSKSSKITITAQNDKAFVITPMKIFELHDATYKLVLGVRKSENEDTKKISVINFSFENTRTSENSNDLEEEYRTYLYNGISDSLKPMVKRDLSATFQTEKRLEISNKLIKNLMLNVYLATAQDF